MNTFEDPYKYSGELPTPKKMHQRLVRKYHPDATKKTETRDIREIEAAYEEAQKGNTKTLEELYKTRFSRDEAAEKERIDTYA